MAMRIVTYVFDKADAHQAVKKRAQSYAKYLREDHWEHGEAFVLEGRQWCDHEIARTMVEQRGHKRVEVREVKHKADESWPTWEVTALVV